MPGSTPPTSQVDWLISTTPIRVLSWSKATRDLLKSFRWGIGLSISYFAATMVPFPRRLPHTISPLEEGVSCELVSEAPAGRSSREPRGWGPQEKKGQREFLDDIKEDDVVES